MPIASGSNFHGIAQEEGNASATLEELYTAWFGKLFNYGRKFSADEGLIEDVIQDIFLHLWQRGNMCVRSLGSYLFTSFRNNLLRRIQQSRQQHTEALSDTYDFDMVLAADQVMIRDESRDESRLKMARALTCLTARQKEFIFLRYYQQLGYEEISEVMGVSVKAVYKLASRSIHLLRRELESEQFMLIATFLHAG